MKNLLFLLLILFNGCTFMKMSTIAPSFEPYRSYNIGDVRETTPGEIMVEEEDSHNLVYSGYQAIADYQPTESVGLFNQLSFPLIETGSQWYAIGRLEDGYYVIRNDSYVMNVPTPRNMCLIVDDDGDTDGFDYCPLDSDSVYRRHWAVKPKRFLKKMERLIFKQQGSFKQQLIYNGIEGASIRISYREFKNDFARPAFTQDLIYDLSPSKIIAFKKMRIEVVEATNSSMKFIIRSPMN